MFVEPYAISKMGDKLNPVGRFFYSASTLISLICIPARRAQDGAMGLAAQAGECHLREVVGRGGFRHYRRATETPFKRIVETRP
ncbi:MAG: hypothetical protein ABI790_18165 [Betaproteobacteria bacterium]